MTIRLIFLTALILGLLSIGATQPAPAAQQSFTTHYYVMPKIGPDPEPKRASDPYDPSIRPKYRDAIDLGKWYRVFDDPLNPNTSLAGSLAMYVLIDAATSTITYLDGQVDVVYFGDDIDEVLATITSLAQVNLAFAALDNRYPTDQDKLDLFKVRTTPLNLNQGTDTTDWTDSDTTAWTALTSNALTQVSISGTNSCTYDVLTNEGQATHGGGGGFFTNFSVWHQTTDNAEDQTVQVEHSSGGSTNHWAHVAGRVKVGATDTFFYGQNEDISGDDTRLYEVVTGTANQLASDTQARIVTAKQMRLQIATNGSNTDIDFDTWASSGSPPGTPQIQFSGAVNAALQGASGYGAVYVKCSRGTTLTVDDLLFTNNDAAPPAGRRIIFIGKLREAASRWF